MHTDKSSRIILDMYSLDLIWDSSGFVSVDTLPPSGGISVVTPLTNISPLSFSPVGEMQVTPVLSKTAHAGYSEYDKPLTIKQSSVSVPPLRGEARWGLMISANEHSPLSFSPVGEMQITLVLSKTIDAGYSGSVKECLYRLLRLMGK